jgi:ketosteroid isomerase-like protein
MSDIPVGARSAWDTVVASTQAFNAGDIEASLAYFSEDVAVKLNGAPPGEPDAYHGKAEARAWLQRLRTQHFEIREELMAAEGNTLRVRALSWSDATRLLGVAPLEATEVYVVQDGKIAHLTWTISPESAARLQAAL